LGRGWVVGFDGVILRCGHEGWDRYWGVGAREKARRERFDVLVLRRDVFRPDEGIGFGGLAGGLDGVEDPVDDWVLGVHGLHVGPAESQGFAEKLHVVAAVWSAGKRDDVDPGGDAEGVDVVLGLSGRCGRPFGEVEVEGRGSEEKEGGEKDEEEQENSRVSWGGKRIFVAHGR